MKYYIKLALLPILYLFFMAVTAYGIYSIKNDNLFWLKPVLFILNIALYTFIIGAVSYKNGEDAIKVRNANDLERREIIRTGEDRPLRLKEEYKPYKGFITALFSLLPLFIFLIAHTIVILCGSTYSGMGVLAEGLYFSIFAIVKIYLGSMTMASYYLTLIAVPYMIAVIGVPYIWGAKKIELQQQRIKEQQRRIYGDIN